MNFHKKMHSKQRILVGLSAGFVMTFASVVSAQPITNHPGQNHQGHEGHEEHRKHGGHQGHQNNQGDEGGHEGHEGHEEHKTKLISGETQASKKTMIDYPSA